MRKSRFANSEFYWIRLQIPDFAYADLWSHNKPGFTNPANPLGGFAKCESGLANDDNPANGDSDLSFKNPGFLDSHFLRIQRVQISNRHKKKTPTQDEKY